MRLSWSLLLLSGCWPFLPGSYDDYVDGDSDDIDTAEGTDGDTDPGTDPDIDTEPDTEPDTERDTEPDTDPDTTPPDGVTNVTIQQLRTGQIAEGTDVRVAGVRVISPQTDFGFWVQTASGGPNSGIYVYDGNTEVINVSVGDRVEVIGEYLEFSSGSGAISEIFVNINTNVVRSGTLNTEHVLDVSHLTLSSSSTAEEYESTLVSIGASEVVSGPDTFGQFWVEPLGGGAQVQVDDLFHNVAPVVGDTYDSITGVLNYRSGSFRIEPRFASDIPAGTSTGGCPAALCVDDLLLEDVLVTEVGFNPSDSIGFDDDNEYVEVFNQSGFSVNLDGLEIWDNANISVVNSDAVIANNSYAVFYRGDIAGWEWDRFGLDRDGSYSAGIAFSNSSGEQISIYRPSGFEPLAQSQFYPTGQVGRSWSLDPRGFSNPQQSNAWCYATTFVGSLDRATPGLPNDTCGNFFP